MKRIIYLSTLVFFFLACGNHTVKNEVLKNGVWVLENDVHSSLLITDSTITFKYDERFSNDTIGRAYYYNLIDSMDIKYVKLSNKTENLLFEILTKNDSLLNFMDTEYGHILTYIPKQ